MNEESIVGAEVYYEKLYKTTGMPGKVFRYVDVDQNSVLFNEFEESDIRYWIDKEPKQVRKM